MNTEALLQTVVRLLTLLHKRQIDYLLVGGIAMLQYVEGRNTEDIALIISVSALQKLPEIVLTSQSERFRRRVLAGHRGRHPAPYRALPAGIWRVRINWTRHFSFLTIQALLAKRHLDAPSGHGDTFSPDLKANVLLACGA